MQFQSDLLGVNVYRPENIETTALGAAYMAAIGSGIKTKEQIKTLNKENKIFNPGASMEKMNELYKGWNEALLRVRNWKKNIS